jgi:hypothetical protein
MHHACGVNETACIVHTVLKTPHALKNRISSQIRIFIRKGFSPLNQGPRTDVLMKKQMVENFVTLSL